ncbi:DUF4157 domain-containing protein [Amycolatopsis sp. cmx-4-68]|uniref:eCIS core domain-containing protein n=1 Tax=Amycolatopsis sp. cmx-4-68 TaxID=2790938 RepID=UPI00397C8647
MTRAFTRRGMAGHGEQRSAAGLPAVARSPERPALEHLPVVAPARAGWDFSRVRLRGAPAAGTLPPPTGIAPAGHEAETRAEAIAGAVAGKPGGPPAADSGVRAAAGQPRARSPLAEGHGRRVPDEVLRPATRLLGPGVVDARVHDSAEDGLFAQRLGARAVTHGADIFLAPGESRFDRRLLAHELAHVAQPPDGLVYLRRATWIERRAWLASFDAPLPRRFLNHYMDDVGTPITLTPAEMADCNPIVDIRRSTAFMTVVRDATAAGGGTRPVHVTGWGGALTNGTLGNFTIHYDGQVTVRSTGEWSFTGSMRFSDFWDFDPKPFGTSGRPVAAEIKVRIAAMGLPGRPFAITSATVPVTQASTDARAVWGSGAAPRPVLDHGARTAADIVAGDVAGGAAGGVVGGRFGGHLGADVGAGGGEVAGTEAGANAAEDLNK